MIRRFFSNGDGDELFFVKAGSGRLESVYGVLPFRVHDYVLMNMRLITEEEYAGMG